MFEDVSGPIWLFPGSSQKNPKWTVLFIEDAIKSLSSFLKIWFIFILFWKCPMGDLGRVQKQCGHSLSPLFWGTGAGTRLNSPSCFHIQSGSQGHIRFSKPSKNVWIQPFSVKMLFYQNRNILWERVSFDELFWWVKSKQIVFAFYVVLI